MWWCKRERERERETKDMIHAGRLNLPLEGCTYFPKIIL